MLTTDVGPDGNPLSKDGYKRDLLSKVGDDQDLNSITGGDQGPEGRNRWEKAMIVFTLQKAAIAETPILKPWGAKPNN